VRLQFPMTRSGCRVRAEIRELLSARGTTMNDARMETDESVTGDARTRTARSGGTSAAVEDRASVAPREGLARFLDVLPHVVWSATPDGRLHDFNSAWSRLIGAAKGERVETAMLKRLHANAQQRWCEHWRDALESGEPYEIEYRLQVDQEAAHWYLERGTPVPQAGYATLQPWLVTATRIASQKRREEELLEKVNWRDEFFSILLQELRNLLAPIANAVELLGAGAGSLQVVNAARDIIQRQLRQLTCLVEDLLDVSRLAHGDIELRRRSLDLAEVVTVAVEAAWSVIKIREQELTVNAPLQPIRIDADPVRLAQVLTNLLVNAGKYTQTGGHISLTTAQEPGVASIRVRDDGIGIAAEKLPVIFELFSRATSTASADGSSLGVGLAVSKQLIELHAGSVCTHSEGIGLGSEFTVRLQICAPS
jgi:signal transduction histidine kinase